MTASSFNNMAALSKHTTMADEKQKSYLKKLKKGIHSLFHKNKTEKDNVEEECSDSDNVKILKKAPINVTSVTALMEKAKNNKIVEDKYVNDDFAEICIKTGDLKLDENKNTIKTDIDNAQDVFTEVEIKPANEKSNQKPKKPKPNDNIDSEIAEVCIESICVKTNDLILDDCEDSTKTKDDDSKSFKTDNRNDSVSSTDSGYSEKDDEDKAVDDVADDLQVLEISDGRKRDKKAQRVFLTRGPLRNQFDRTAMHPYQHVNRHILSGGTLNVNPSYDEPSSQDDLLQDIEGAIQANTLPTDDLQTTVEKLFVEKSFDSNDLVNLLNNIRQDVSETLMPEITEEVLSNFAEVPNQTEEAVYNSYPIDDTFITDFAEVPTLIDEFNASSLLTPPMSNEHVFSPIPNSPNQSFYSSPYRNISPYTNSPPSSNHFPSPGKSDSYDEENTFNFEEHIPSCVMTDEEGVEKPKRERAKSNSSFTMKWYKDMQNELSSEFSKRDCCKTNRESGKDVLKRHFMKLDAESRKNMCLNVAKLDMKTLYGLAHKILLSLSTGDDQVDVQYALFGLICERVLVEDPGLWLEDFGHNLLSAAVLRCPRRPVLARSLVQCVRAAAASKMDGRSIVFQQTDLRGDNLLCACARRGDACSDVLSELVREPGVRLFDVDHCNAEGYTALHVACKTHSASLSCLHTVHVLIAHGGADLWKGDIKGGDTACHLAVNSVHCALSLVMALFKHADRSEWKRLAHKQNRSSVTPLEYARSATKSTTRQNYPQEVLNFLKKCR
ncbi:unnamed protein product [Plutella xylostella]|uniref:(diamondback moth) hypothetical protein n=1 Tax=Plutella xylostella TaxID=51655 RepID=A0A8S4EV83_PLUXY|nr:unnamed protein product [Plutella xylostella]